jgi:hypothetical protein
MIIIYNMRMLLVRKNSPNWFNLMSGSLLFSHPLLAGVGLNSLVVTVTLLLRPYRRHSVDATKNGRAHWTVYGDKSLALLQKDILQTVCPLVLDAVFCRFSAKSFCDARCEPSFREQTIQTKVLKKSWKIQSCI